MIFVLQFNYISTYADSLVLKVGKLSFHFFIKFHLDNIRSRLANIVFGKNDQNQQSKSLHLAFVLNMMHRSCGIVIFC